MAAVAIVTSSSRLSLPLCPLRLVSAPSRGRNKPLSLCLQRRHLASLPGETESTTPRTLHSNPWEFQSKNPGNNPTRTSKARQVMEIMAAASKGDYSKTLAIASQMKDASFKPDISTYNSLLQAASRDKSWLDTWAIFDDMMATGIHPTTDTFNHLIRAHDHRPSPYIWRILERMNNLGVLPNSTTFALIVRRYVLAENLEMALQYIYAAKARNVLPEFNSVQSVIVLAAELGQPRLAIDLILWFEEDSARKFDHVTWVHCLNASADSLYAGGVKRCWKKVVHDMNTIPGEGICIAVLNTAARHGLSDIAHDVLRVLETAKVILHEYHFAALVEACVKGDQVKDALIALKTMRDKGVEPRRSTVIPLLTVIGRSVDSIDYISGVLDDMHKDGQPIDISTLNLVIEASVAFDDLQRAIGMYKSFGEYGMQPDLTTFNLLLDGCIAAGHRRLGDLLLADMKEVKARPDKNTYAKMIYLCLTQDMYEDAFFYLEEMKSAGHSPPLTVYEALIRKCITNDDSRYTIALEEMKECGYDVSQGLLKLIMKKSSTPKEGRSLDTANSENGTVLLDAAVQKSIDSGGIDTETQPQRS